jgi:CheY-like chemotaxis protein
VADTLEDLRLNIDALIERLSASRSEESPSPAAEATPADVLDHHIEDLGLKVEGATDLLAELADLLESQSERIETIEQQLGDPDEFLTAPEPQYVRQEPADPQPAVGNDGVDAFAIAEVLRDLKFWLDDRFARVESAVSRLDAAVAEVRDLGAEGDRRVRELEERLLILVDSGLERSLAEPVVPVEAVARHAAQFAAGGELGAAAVSGATGMAPMPSPEPEPPPLNLRHRPVAETAAAEAVAPEVGDVPARAFPGEPQPTAFTPTPAYQPASAFAAVPSPEDEALGRTQSYGPMDGTAARRLEELVEREVRLQQTFVPGAEVPPASHSVRADRKRPTVMVVDDSADARTILSIYLSKTGYQVVTAASAEDCLAKLRHHNVDAVILDSSMPGGGGAHVCRVLRDDPMYRGPQELPIIVYTAHPDAFSREEAAGLGASDYVIKSGDMLPLITSLVRHTKTQGR